LAIKRVAPNLNVSGEITLKQHEAVIQAMKNNGGYASLGLLYQEAQNIPDVAWNTKTPHNSIRRIVQKSAEFFKIRPGLWGLKEYKNQLPSELFAAPDSKEPQAVEFNHTYYQGLLVLIGNMKSFETFIPAQNQNNRFFNMSLGDAASLKGKIYPFSNEKIVNKARNIDVIWFNMRQMPQRVFEVEHTTDFIRSLDKFVNLQDFKTEFYIVADRVKERELSRKLTSDSFIAIRESVKFLSYQNVQEWHDKVSELVSTERKIGV
jgi:hypothetical protein